MDVFVKREAKVEPGFTVGAILGRKAVKGDVGIEIEVEGSRLPKFEDVPQPWGYHPDGSLRGEDNAEYVLNAPLPFDGVEKALETLWAAFKKRGSRIDDSNRTSVHVHLNCQNFHFNRLTSFIALWLCMEEVLTEWCGDHRVGNLFCLRAKDAPATVRMLRSFLRTDGKYRFPESFHYAGLNAHALQKFGSIEVRTLRGVADPNIIRDWVSILRRLYELSGEYPDPRDICANFSQFGPQSFFSHLLGDQEGTVRSGISFSNDQIAESMYEGIRLAQDLCYCRNWDVFKAIDIKADPFGRSLSKVMNQLGAGAGGAPAVAWPDPQYASDDADLDFYDDSPPQSMAQVAQAMTAAAHAIPTAHPGHYTVAPAPAQQIAHTEWVNQFIHAEPNF